MKRIKYRREYDVTIIEEYTADVPEHLLDDDSSLGRASLDQYVSDNFVPDHEDRLGMTEDSLSGTFTVLGDVEDEAPDPPQKGPDMVRITSTTFDEDGTETRTVREDGVLEPHVMVKYRHDPVPVIWESPLPSQLAQEPVGEWAPATDDEYRRYFDHYSAIEED